MSACPNCGENGRSVHAVTLESQVEPAVLSGISDRTEWLFCGTPECDVVYFSGGDGGVVNLASVAQVPFQKSSLPKRLVCFCFGHSVEDVVRDAAASETSLIRDAIKAACKAGLDSCAIKNPQGRCCLGNVGHVIRGQQDLPGPTVSECCAPAESGRASVRKSGLVVSTGAISTALLSSACCWLPLLVLGMGASAAGVGAFFEVFRVPLLLVSVGLLGGGFYLAYRKPACAEDDDCQEPNSRLNRALLWFTTLVVIAFAAFPEYVGALNGRDEISLQSENATTTYYKVEGMTCGACEVHTREAIEQVPGVVSAAVSFRDERARVDWDRTPDHAAVMAAVEGVGYRAELID